MTGAVGELWPDDNHTPGRTEEGDIVGFVEDLGCLCTVEPVQCDSSREWCCRSIDGALACPVGGQLLHRATCQIVQVESGRPDDRFRQVETTRQQQEFPRRARCCWRSGNHCRRAEEPKMTVQETCHARTRSSRYNQSRKSRIRHSCLCTVGLGPFRKAVHPCTLHSRRHSFELADGGLTADVPPHSRHSHRRNPHSPWDSGSYEMAEGHRNNQKHDCTTAEENRLHLRSRHPT